MRGEIAAALARIKIASVNFFQSKEIGKTLLNKLFEIFVFFPFKIEHGRKSDVDEPVFFQHAAIELGMRKAASSAQAVGDYDKFFVGIRLGVLAHIQLFIRERVIHPLLMFEQYFHVIPLFASKSGAALSARH